LSERQRSSKPRTYRLGARQDEVDRTRLRITEATMKLHEEVGPAATTTSAIAELAGVTRLTVYRHFPDSDALIFACSAHWRGLHPRPDIEAWCEVDDPMDRVRLALRQTYAWAKVAAPMMSMIMRDIDQLPAVLAAGIHEDDRRRVRALTERFARRGRAARRMETVVAHALDVRTWQSLCEGGGLREEEMVELMSGLVAAAAGLPGSRPTGRGR
jgi:AcrR family transcriptional regulator